MRFVCADLPFPPPELNPNRRVEKHQKNKLFQGYKLACYRLVKQAANHARAKPHEFHGKYPIVNIQYEVAFPDRRRRDEDNFIASMKAAQDGISAALGVNDCYFHLKEIIHVQPVKHGRVLAHISWKEEK